MSESTQNTLQDVSRHSLRISIGPRKGQFMKKRKNVNNGQKKSVKRLCNNSQLTLNQYAVCSGEREKIESAFFSNQMWCNECNIPLSLDFATSKVQKGLANVYTVKCYKCPFIKTVHTSSTFGEKERYMTINAKAAMGMIDCGIGGTQMNSFLSAMNIQSLSENLLKRYERIIGKEVEAVALESCSESLGQEKLLTIAANDAVADE